MTYIYLQPFAAATAQFLFSVLHHIISVQTNKLAHESNLFQVTTLCYPRLTR